MQQNDYNEETQTHSSTHAFKIDDCANEIPLKKDGNGEYIEKNPYFFQFNKGTYPAFRKLMRDYPIAGNIMLFLIEHMDSTNSVTINYGALSEVFGKTRQCLSKAIQHLKGRRFIKVFKTGNMNVYCLNANVVWHRSRENIKYAKFKSHVYMTDKEQMTKEDNREKIEKTQYFYQLNKKMFPAFRKLMMDYPMAGNIMLFLMEQMDNTNSVIISYEALSEVFRKTRQCLSKAIKYLKEEKFIGVYRTGNMNVYCLNANVVWHRSRENIKYAKFKTNVYMTYNEQMVKENKLKNVIAKQLKK